MKAYSDSVSRAVYVADNDLQELPDDITGFMDFYEARKARLRDRLQKTLGVKPTMKNSS